jgi:hypothetical protein
MLENAMEDVVEEAGNVQPLVVTSRAAAAPRPSTALVPIPGRGARTLNAPSRAQATPARVVPQLNARVNEEVRRQEEKRDDDDEEDEDEDDEDDDEEDENGNPVDMKTAAETLALVSKALGQQTNAVMQMAKDPSLRKAGEERCEEEVARLRQQNENLKGDLYAAKCSLESANVKAREYDDVAAELRALKSDKFKLEIQMAELRTENKFLTQGRDGEGGGVGGGSVAATKAYEDLRRSKDADYDRLRDLMNTRIDELRQENANLQIQVREIELARQDAIRQSGGGDAAVANSIRGLQVPFNQMRGVIDELNAEVQKLRKDVHSWHQDQDDAAEDMVTNNQRLQDNVFGHIDVLRKEQVKNLNKLMKGLRGMDLGAGGDFFGGSGTERGVEALATRGVSGWGVHDAIETPAMYRGMFDVLARERKGERYIRPDNFYDCYSGCADFAQMVACELKSKSCVRVAACHAHVVDLNRFIGKYEEFRFVLPGSLKTFIAYSMDAPIPDTGTNILDPSDCPKEKGSFKSGKGGSGPGDGLSAGGGGALVPVGKLDLSDLLAMDKELQAALDEYYAEYIKRKTSQWKPFLGKP